MGSFSKLGNKIFIIIIRPEQKKPRINSFVENGINVVEIHPPNIGLKGKKGISRYLSYLACLPSVSKISSKIIKENQIDYVYSYMPGIGSSLPAIRSKSKHKVQYILDYADLDVFIRPKRLLRKSIENANKIIAITEYLKNILIERGVEKNKIIVVPNGVDLDLFDTSKIPVSEIQQLRNSFGASNLIFFVGSLQDLNMIINSALLVVKSVDDVKYVIIGDHRDPNRSKVVWEKKVSEKGLSNHFVFLGKKPREEIPKYLACADICLDSFPDEPYYAAAHPIKLLEYGACGKPVVATRVAETAKIIKHDEYGFLADPGNPEQYAKCIVELLNSKPLCEKFGKNFSAYVKDNFSWIKIASYLQKELSK